MAARTDGTVPYRFVSQFDLKGAMVPGRQEKADRNALPYLVLEPERGVVGEEANELEPEADTLMGVMAMGLGVARGVV